MVVSSFSLLDHFIFPPISSFSPHFLLVTVQFLKIDRCFPLFPRSPRLLAWLIASTLQLRLHAESHTTDLKLRSLEKDLAGGDDLWYMLANYHHLLA
jgi:hypothetical protein